MKIITESIVLANPHSNYCCLPFLVAEKMWKILEALENKKKGKQREKKRKNFAIYIRKVAVVVVSNGR